MNDTFWDEYSRLVARLMPPLSPGDGMSEAEVEAAETRLGLRLPSRLREFYLLAGGREDINASSDRLLDPEDLEVRDGVLVFYEENQNVVLWGLDPSSDAPDPPVLHAEHRDTLEWEPEHDHLSQFLTAMLFWQAVNGGMPYVGIGTASSESITSASGWEAVDLGGAPDRWGDRVRMRDGQVLFGDLNEPAPEVYGGGRTRDDFLALEEAFDISWGYSTLDEEEDDNEDEEE